jgi:segregation and condensation protein A
MDYLVTSGEFQGPVHLLLQLITDRKMHVSEVSLAVVTEDFLKFIAEHTLSYSQVSSFIVVASTLVLVKARSLLPSMELSEEEEESIQDLTERVRQYQIIQKYSELLASKYQKEVAFERIWQDRNPVFAPDPQITLAGLQGLLESVFVAFPILEKLPEKAIKVVVKLEEVIENLSKRIQSGIAFHSRDIMDKYKNATDPTEKRQAKVFAVVSFLAILELVKKGIGNVMQGENFGDIELSTPSADLAVSRLPLREGDIT